MSPHKVAIQQVIASWRSLAELATFAAERRGYGNSDGGFGVIYPDDLDAYDREVEQVNIPDGHVEIYGYWGLPDGFEQIIPERDYLTVLTAVLQEANLLKEAQLVEGLYRGDMGV